MIKTAIIVDDEPITRLDIESMLNDIGIKVVAFANDGFDAIDECKRHNPNIVIMDINMPVFDGMSATKTIIEENLCDCVIMLTAYSDSKIINQAIELGVSNYLIKPISVNQLLPAIEISLKHIQNVNNYKKEIKLLNAKIENNKKIDIAKGLIAKSKKISESEAYKLIHKMSMDKRVSVHNIAERIISINSKRHELETAKSNYMKIAKVSEKVAYESIKDYMKQNKCSAEIAVKKLINEIK